MTSLTSDQRERERSLRKTQLIRSALALHKRSNKLLELAAQYKPLSTESILFVEMAAILRDCARINRQLADDIDSHHDRSHSDR